MGADSDLTWDQQTNQLIWKNEAKAQRMIGNFPGIHGQSVTEMPLGNTQVYIGFTTPFLIALLLHLFLPELRPQRSCRSLLSRGAHK